MSSDGNSTPPCGLIYRHASGNGTYLAEGHHHLARSPGRRPRGTGGRLDDGVFDTTQDVTVQEIQSVNR